MKTNQVSVSPVRPEDGKRQHSATPYLARPSSKESSGSRVSGYGCGSVRSPKVSPYGPKEYLRPSSFEIKMQNELLAVKEMRKEMSKEHSTEVDENSVPAATGSNSLRSFSVSPFKNSVKQEKKVPKKDFNKKSYAALNALSQLDKPEMLKGPPITKELQPAKIYVSSRSDAPSNTSQDDWVLLEGKTFANLPPADENMPNRPSNIVPQVETSSNVWIRPNLYLKDFNSTSLPPSRNVSSHSLEEGLIFQGGRHVRRKKVLQRSFENETDIPSTPKGLRELKSPSPFLSNTSVNRIIAHPQGRDNTEDPSQTSSPPTFRLSTINEEKNKYIENSLKVKGTDTPPKRLLSRPTVLSSSFNNSSFTSSKIEQNAGIHDKSSTSNISSNTHGKVSSVFRNPLTDHTTTKRNT
ncbi:uncharacterized protein LOC106663879 [Cimex lectularius]|uniref:Uncharacterized protein n=1 Tax=Cimex lectularius TaxID=79782 RepID=A0A8I6RJR0_CIMLE|nr:uncharacterized protein LOC106663879 [Cimex lectularius]